jgi:hypothetical protein
MRALPNGVLPLAILGWVICADALAADARGRLIIHIEDVGRFYEVYDAAAGHPTAETLQQYIDQGSEGLRYFARARNTTGVRIADEISKHPELYATYEKPGDLGYWDGYRICKANYQHAKDKRQAFRDILEISDPKLFRAKSGWYPGIVLQ